MSGAVQEQPVKRMPGAAADQETMISSRVSQSDSTGRRNDLDTASIQNDDSNMEDGDMSILHESIMKESRTIDDFTRIIADWRTEREQRQRGDGASTRTSFYGEAGLNGCASAAGAKGLQVKGSTPSLRKEANNNRLSLDVDAASQYSYEASSVGDPDEMDQASTSPAASLSPLAVQAEGASKNVKVRCTCCCGRGTRRCKRARRATREWSEVESDLRLAAEIGQALLRKNDSLTNELNQSQQEYTSRVDSLMKKLTYSIREASQLDKSREQSELNLEAAEASNRSLVRELDETRRELTKLRGVDVRNTGLEGNLQRSFREVKDLKQELTEERKKTKKAEKMHADAVEEVRLAQIEAKRQIFNEDDRARRREEMKAMVEARVASASSKSSAEDRKWTEDLVIEVDNLQQENAQLREMLESRSEELEQLREEGSQRSDVAGAEGEKRQLRLSDVPARTFGALSNEYIEDTQPAHPSLRSLSLSPTQSAQNGSERPSSSLLSPRMVSDSMFSPAASVASNHTAETTLNDLDETAKVDQATSTSTLLAATPATQPALSKIKETRTAQLTALIEMIQRIFSRLANADVETLSKRLQKQNLTGDVGHLALTTVNGIVRDVEALREHFRKALEAEIRGRDIDTASTGSRNSAKVEKESDSLVAKKEFFALIKVFRELFVEIAKLRKAVNEVSLQPQNAAKILQEHLLVNASEDKGMGAWIGRLFAAAPLPGVSSLTATSSANAVPSQTISAASASRPITGRVTSGPQLTSRASATIVPSTAAVEVKGSHAVEQPSSTAAVEAGPSLALAVPSQPRRSLSRVQSRNLSGLFVGSVTSHNDGSNEGPINYFGPSHSRLASEQTTRNHRLSRIVDDDEIHSYQSSLTPKMGRRPRNLSDSSIRTTYMEDEDKVVGSRQLSNGSKAPAPISRIITPSTLSLQASSAMHAGIVHSYTSSSGLSEDDSASTITSAASTKEVASPSFLSSLAAPRSTVSKALSFLTAPPSHPPLRSASSSAKLSLAAAEGSATLQRQLPNRNGSEDLFRVGQTRARDMGF